MRKKIRALSTEKSLQLSFIIYKVNGGHWSCEVVWLPTVSPYCLTAPGSPAQSWVQATVCAEFCMLSLCLHCLLQVFWFPPSVGRSMIQQQRQPPLPPKSVCVDYFSIMSCLVCYIYSQRRNTNCVSILIA